MAYARDAGRPLELDIHTTLTDKTIAAPTASTSIAPLFGLGQMASAALTARPREAAQLNPEALEFISSRSGSESGSPVRCSSPVSSAQARCMALPPPPSGTCCNA